MMTFPTEWKNKTCSKPPTSLGVFLPSQVVQEFVTIHSMGIDGNIWDSTGIYWISHGYGHILATGKIHYMFVLAQTWRPTTGLLHNHPRYIRGVAFGK